MRHGGRKNLWLLEVLENPEDKTRAKEDEEEERAQKAREVVRDVDKGRRLLLHKEICCTRSFERQRLRSWFPLSIARALSSFKGSRARMTLAAESGHPWRHTDGTEKRRRADLCYAAAWWVKDGDANEQKTARHLCELPPPEQRLVLLMKKTLRTSGRRSLGKMGWDDERWLASLATRSCVSEPSFHPFLNSARTGRQQQRACDQQAHRVYDHCGDCPTNRDPVIPMPAPHFHAVSTATRQLDVWLRGEKDAGLSL